MEMNPNNIIGFNEDDTAWISKTIPYIMFDFFEYVNSNGVIYPFTKVIEKYNNLKIICTSKWKFDEQFGEYNSETNEISISSTCDSDEVIPTIVHEFLHFLTHGIKTNTRPRSYYSIDEVITEYITGIIMFRLFRVERHTNGIMGINTNDKVFDMLQNKCGESPLLQAYVEQDDWHYEKILGIDILEKLQTFYEYIENFDDKYRDTSDIKKRLETDLKFEKEKLDMMFAEFEKSCEGTTKETKKF